MEGMMLFLGISKHLLFSDIAVTVLAKELHHYRSKLPINF